VAVARLLGYRWPAETDPHLELAPEARVWVERSAQLAPLALSSAVLVLPAEAPLRALLAAAFGPRWSPALEEELLQAEGFGGRGLAAWLRRGCAAQHLKLFRQRPFLWHLGDPHPRGFSALVNYHRLARPALESLLNQHLPAWFQGPGLEPGARLPQAQALQRALEQILAGTPPCDLFVRWKPLEGQPCGWDPDLEDGVRINIRPFVLSGALASVPRLHWRTDRGRDADTVPRFLPLQGVRANDWHLPRVSAAGPWP
jgi:hypothetical protein